MVDKFIDFLKNTEVSYQSKVQTLEYWILDESNATNGSEQTIVDFNFTPYLLELLGYSKSNYSYNQHGRKDGNIPDFRIEHEGETLFCIEDKSLHINIAPNALSSSIEEQVNRYLSISGTVILTNTKRIIVFGRKDRKPSIEIDIDLKTILKKDSLLVDDHIDTLMYFFERFQKSSVTDRLSSIRQYAVGEEKWKAQALDISDNLQGFIDKSQPVLNSLKTEVSSQVYSNILRFQEYQDKKEIIAKEFIEDYGVYADVLNSLLGAGSASVLKNFIIDFDFLKEQISKKLHSGDKVSRNDREASKKLIEGLTIASRKSYVLRAKNEQAIEIAESIKRWAERNKLFGEEESARFMAKLCDGSKDEACRNNLRQFSAEVAYTFFMRFFIIRVIEDKEILKNRGIRRVLTDGGLETWLKILDVRIKNEGTAIRGRELMEEANMLAVEVFQDFEEKFSYYNWFVPRDYSIIHMIRIFSAYNFSHLRKDIIGYTWEEFKIAKERHKQGQYLTPTEIVQKILNQVNYTEDNKDIIAQKIIDPSCGSGTFLIEAISRLREVYMKDTKGDIEKEKKARQEFLHKVQNNIYGFEIDSFSWYLATMNIYLSIIDDISWLIENGEDVHIDHINLFHTDALNNYPNKDDSLTHLQDEDMGRKKDFESSFSYVVGNPPYASAKNEKDIVVEQIRSDNFYDNWFEGDINLFVPFFKVANFLLLGGGKLSFIHPINLWADSQTLLARERISEHFSPLSMYRFLAHRKGAVFKNVLQDVGISTLQKGHSSGLVHIGGTWDISSLKRGEETWDIVDAVEVFKYSKFRVYPEKNIYHIENHTKKLNFNFLDLLVSLGVDEQELTGKGLKDTGKIQRYYKGTVNATHVWKKDKLHILKADESGTRKKMPLYKGSSVYYMSPLPAVPSSYQTTDKKEEFRFVRLPKSTEDREVHNKLRRIWKQKEPFWYIAHLEIYDNNDYRGIKAFGDYWDASRKSVFPHTMYVLEVEKKESAMAVSALLCSSVFQLMYGLVSTNQHVNKKPLLNLPIPSLTVPSSLISSSERAHKLGSDFLEQIKDYSAFNKISSGITNITDKKWTDVDTDKIIKIFSIESFLKKHKTQTITLQDYIDASKIETKKIMKKTGEKRYDKLEYLFSSDSLTQKAIELLYIEYGSKTIIPASISLPEFISLSSVLHDYELFISKIKNIGNSFTIEIKNIDNIVIDWFGLGKYKATFEKGLPWTK